MDSISLCDSVQTQQRWDIFKQEWSKSMKNGLFTTMWSVKFTGKKKKFALAMHTKSQSTYQEGHLYYKLLPQNKT